eukprot:g6565.t1
MVAKGNDANPGTESRPLKTLSKALDLARARTSQPNDRIVVLRAGTHYLEATIEIGPDLSGLQLQNYPAEEVWVSGGDVLNGLQWEPADDINPPAAKVFRAKLPASVAAVPGLNRVDFDDPLHARMSRARFPNRDLARSGTQEHSLLSQGSSVWEKPVGWGTDPAFKVSKTVFLEKPAGDRAAGKCGDFFTYGVDGATCDRYTPAGGFWCSANSSGGGSGWELMVPGAPLFPVALTLNTSAPATDPGFWAAGQFAGQAPPDPMTWRNKTGAI